MIRGDYFFTNVFVTVPSSVVTRTKYMPLARPETLMRACTGVSNNWKGSSAHNAVIVNQGIWHDSNWQAIGVGMYKGYACVWFGNEKDPVEFRK